MSERFTGRQPSDQLTLPIEWWQSFAEDPETIKLEQTIDNLAMTPEHRSTNERHKDIQKLQIDLAGRALRLYGVNKIGKIKNFENAYQFDFRYGGSFVDTVWYNHKSLSAKTWKIGIDKPQREAVWGFYKDELAAWNDTQVTGKRGSKGQADRLYDPMLKDLCVEYGFRHFTLRTSSHKPHVRTRHVLPAALHLIDMPIADAFPVIGPGQDDIEVIEPGKIVSQRGYPDSAWVMDNQGHFIQSQPT